MLVRIASRRVTLNQSVHGILPNMFYSCHQLKGKTNEEFMVCVKILLNCFKSRAHQTRTIVAGMVAVRDQPESWLITTLPNTVWSQSGPMDIQVITAKPDTVPYTKVTMDTCWVPKHQLMAFLRYRPILTIA